MSLELKANLESPIFTGIVSGITKSMVGLSNADNTSDNNKQVSKYQQNALNYKQDLINSTSSLVIGKITTTEIVSNGVLTIKDNLNVGNNSSDIVTFYNNMTINGITKSTVDLSNADNVSDSDKPVSTAQQTALDFKAPLASPTFTGIPNAPTAIQGTNTNQIATTTFVNETVSLLVNSAPETLNTLNELALALGNDANFSSTITTLIASKAPLNSPTFTGPVSVTGAFVSQATKNIMETISTASISSNAVTCDYASSALYYLTGLSSATNFALTLTNINPASSTTVSNSITLLIDTSTYLAYANSIILK